MSRYCWKRHCCRRLLNFIDQLFDELRRSGLWRLLLPFRSLQSLTQIGNWDGWSNCIYSTAMASDTYQTSPSWNTNERVLVIEGIYAFERIGTKAREPARCYEQRRRVDVRVLICWKINSMLANVYIPTENFMLLIVWVCREIIKTFFMPKTIKTVDKNACKTM